MNKVLLLGNLTRDPEVKALPSGQSLAKFGLATNRRWKNKDGEKQEETTFHNIVVWGKQAENCGAYLAKGRQVLIEGEIKNGSYEKDGVKHYTTDIVASNVQFIGGGGGAAPAAAADDADDLPF